QVAVKFVQKTPNTKYISTPFHPEPLPLEIALAIISNWGLSCPNIIQVLDWQDDPEHHVMIMEHPLPGVNMHKFLKLNRGVLKEHTAQRIMQKVIYAISICCYQGVFHGDIKLTNLLINLSTLEVKLIDFGCGDLMRDSAYLSFRGMHYVSRFVVSLLSFCTECCNFMQDCVQRHPEHMLPLEHMHCHDWFLLGFPMHVTQPECI
ncbi:hypothetical protein PO909_030675, partial [Leuciscus waleckii]